MPTSTQGPSSKHHGMFSTIFILEEASLKKRKILRQCPNLSEMSESKVASDTIQNKKNELTFLVFSHANKPLFI